MLRTQISLSAEDRRILDAESARTGRSMSALIRDAVSRAYATPHDVSADVRAIEDAAGAWRGREMDGRSYVDGLRRGDRLRDVDAR